MTAPWFICDGGMLNSARAIHANGDRKHATPAHMRWQVVDESFLKTNGAGRDMWLTDSTIPLAADAMVNGWNTIGILLEPPELHPENYDAAADALRRGWIRQLYTSRPERFDRENLVLPYPHGGTRIHESDWMIHQKDHSKLPSIVASPKRSLPGHALRHKLIEDFPDRLQPFGEDYGGRLEHKIESLREYPFQLAIENVAWGAWFTEALLDCFLTGTVPIYWGSREAIRRWGFNQDGIIMLPLTYSAKLVEQTLDTMATTSWYVDHYSAIESNFLRAHWYTCPEDWLAAQRGLL